MPSLYEVPVGHHGLQFMSKGCGRVAKAIVPLILVVIVMVEWVRVLGVEWVHGGDLLVLGVLVLGVEVKVRVKLVVVSQLVLDHIVEGKGLRLLLLLWCWLVANAACSSFLKHFII